MKLAMATCLCSTLTLGHPPPPLFLSETRALCMLHAISTWGTANSPGNPAARPTAHHQQQ